LEKGKIRTSPLLEFSLEQESNCCSLGGGGKKKKKTLWGLHPRPLQDVKKGTSQTFQMTCAGEK